MAILNRSETARFLGVKALAVDAFLAEGMPFVERPAIKGGSPWKIDSEAARAWMLERQKARAEKDSLVGVGAELLADGKQAAARQRKLEAEAALKEHELVIEQRKVASVQEIEERWGTMVTTAKSKLLAMPTKLGPLVAVEDDPAKCQELIRAAVYQALKELQAA